MRELQLRDMHTSQGGTLAERNGVEVVSSFSDYKTEYNHVREAAGVTDFSFMQKYRIPEESGIDFLDQVVAGNVAKLRFGRVLHTFIADGKGELVADCYVANNDEELIVLCESLVADTKLTELFNSHGGAEAGLEDLSSDRVLIGVDGFKAWTVAKELFGADVLGLPYLSIEMYQFEGHDVQLFRAGKTSEFGYLIMAPADIGAALLKRLQDCVAEQGGGPVGVDTHDKLRLEGRFFNIHAEGAAVRDPLVLGLQWMIDFEKDTFAGYDAIMERRSQGLKRKIVGVATDSGVEGLRGGAGIYDGTENVAEVVAACHSYALDTEVGLAVFPFDLAYAGLQFNLDSADGPAVKTISMPPIMPKSLTVKLDEM